MIRHYLGAGENPQELERVYYERCQDGHPLAVWIAGTHYLGNSLTPHGCPFCVARRQAEDEVNKLRVAVADQLAKLSARVAELEFNASTE